jgi:hypothetical protein
MMMSLGLKKYCDVMVQDEFVNDFYYYQYYFDDRMMQLN